MDILFVILGMSLATYLPRLLPALVMDRFTIPAWVNRWLKSIPYAALGALIIPGVFTIEKTAPAIGVIGGIAAAVMAYFRLHIMYVVFGAVVCVILVKVCFY